MKEYLRRNLRGIEHSLYQEDVIIPNIDAPNEIASRYVKKMYKKKKELSNP